MILAPDFQDALSQIFSKCRKEEENVCMQYKRNCSRSKKKFLLDMDEDIDLAKSVDRECCEFKLKQVSSKRARKVQHRCTFAHETPCTPISPLSCLVTPSWNCEMPRFDVKLLCQSMQLSLTHFYARRVSRLRLIKRLLSASFSCT